MRHIALLVSSSLLVASCYDEARFGTFDQSKVLTISFEGETAPSQIDSGDAVIQVTFAHDTNLAEVKLATLTVSSLAKASVSPGQTMNLRDEPFLLVTAEDGSTTNWQIEADLLAPPGQGGGSPGLGGSGGEGGECESYVLTYQLTGTFSLTDTPGGLGNGVFSVGPGELSLRLVPTGADGEAEATLLSYRMPQYFVVEAPGAVTTNDSEATAGPHECGLALGQLKGNTVSWAECDYGPSPPQGSTAWAPNDVVGGPGCIQGYQVKGSVTCTGSFCSVSGVDFPIVLDDDYPQPLNSFQFGPSFSTLSMRGIGAPPGNAGYDGVELPNVEPSRSWLGLDGTLVSQICQPLPSCD